MTILLGALIIGGVVGVVGIKMQPNYDESRLQPIIVDPNEKFVGYVDGQYRAQSRQQASAPQASLARDAAFTRLVAPLTSPAEGRYHHPDIGEVLYVAVPVTLSGDPARGVITAAYLADAERTGADEAARLMLIVGAATMLGAVGAAWLVAGRILRPLRDITETARTITDTDLSGRIPWRGGDELGGLVATVNGMLDRVETGVAAQRRFIDDAGHELRAQQDRQGKTHTIQIPEQR